MRFIRAEGHDQVELPIHLEALDNGDSVPVLALLDSGCTGSVVDADFVRKHNFRTRTVHMPVPVFNADGSANAQGAISEFVELRMRFNGHNECILFGVSKLARHSVFLGHDWLKLHNPSVNWSTGNVVLDRCPHTCQYMPDLETVEDDEPDKEEEPVQTSLSIDQSDLEEGDCLFVFAWDMYIRTHAADIAAAKNAQKEEKSIKDQVPSYLHDFMDVFEKKDFDKLPERRPWDHAIELTTDFQPVDCKVYPMAPNEQKELDVFLEENLRSGRIVLSKSPMASPFFFIKKKDGKLRSVQDYRKLNDMTIKNRYPLPLIQELLDKLKNAKYFTKFDVCWGYNNVRIKEGNEWKAAFRTNRGLFEPLVMFFGLTNSPATFQTMMNDIFKGLIARGVVVVYLDDILIFTATLEEHRQIVREVLEILRQHKLYLRPEKCDFERLAIKYLGIIVSNDCIEMDPSKVEAVMDWPRLDNKHNVRSFLGFCNFYRRFIKDFAKTARPLNDLTADVPFTWTDECSLAFDALKMAICSRPILAIPNDDSQFRVKADTSNFALGAVLSQKQPDGKWHPTAFMSKSLTSTERNYEIYDRELLAIMTALAEWRQYLMGATQPFEIWSSTLR